MYPGNSPFGNPYGGGRGPYRGGPFGGQRKRGASAYQYQYMEQPAAQAGSLISKVMALMATSFLVATVGAFLSVSVLPLSFGGYLFVAISGFVVLLALQMAINVRGLNLGLLFP